MDKGMSEEEAMKAWQDMTMSKMEEDPRKVQKPKTSVFVKPFWMKVMSSRQTLLKRKQNPKKNLLKLMVSRSPSRKSLPLSSSVLSRQRLKRLKQQQLLKRQKKPFPTSRRMLQSNWSKQT
jgi:hypothetical protein